MVLAGLAAGGCGGGAATATPAPSSAPSPSAGPARLTPDAPPPRRKGLAHDVAGRLAAAIEAGDARAAADTFAEGGVLVRFRGADVRGPAAVEPVFRQAFGLCRMHVVTILEREYALVMKLASSCVHPETKLEQNHLLAIDVVADRIARAAVLTELLGAQRPAGAPLRREVEDPATLTPERERRAACTIDGEREMLPTSFGGLEREVWATPACTVLVVRGDARHRAAHGYIEIECAPRGLSCTRAADSHRYIDWNGYRLLPFADEVYTAKTQR